VASWLAEEGSRGELSVVVVGRPLPSHRQPQGRGGGACRARGRHQQMEHGRRRQLRDPARQLPLHWEGSREGRGRGREEARHVDAGTVAGVGEVGSMGASGAPRTSRRRRKSDHWEEALYPTAPTPCHCPVLRRLDRGGIYAVGYGLCCRSPRAPPRQRVPRRSSRRQTQGVTAGS
jgi:hypothetical protein